MKHKNKIDQTQKDLAPIFTKNRVTKTVVFGSMAKETASCISDLHLMIVMQTDKRFFDRYELFDEVYDVIDDRAVDMLIYTPEELQRISHRSFINKILKEGRVIYEN